MTSPLAEDFSDDKLRAIFTKIDYGFACGLAAWRFECKLRSIIKKVNSAAFSDKKSAGQDHKTRANDYEIYWKEVINYYLTVKSKGEQEICDIQEQYSLKNILPKFTLSDHTEDFLIHLFHIRDLQLHGRRPYPRKIHNQQDSLNHIPEEKYPSFDPYHYLACRDFEVILAGTHILDSFIKRIDKNNNADSEMGILLSKKTLSKDEETVVREMQDFAYQLFPDDHLKAAELFCLISDIFFEKHITRILEQLNSKGNLPDNTVVNLLHGIKEYKEMLNKATSGYFNEKHEPITQILQFVPNDQKDDFLFLIKKTVNQLRHCGEYELPDLKNKKWKCKKFQELSPEEQVQEIWKFFGTTLIEITVKLAKELDSSLSVSKGRISRKGSYKN